MLCCITEDAKLMSPVSKKAQSVADMVQLSYEVCVTLLKAKHN